MSRAGAEVEVAAALPGCASRDPMRRTALAAPAVMRGRGCPAVMSQAGVERGAASPVGIAAALLVEGVGFA